MVTIPHIVMSKITYRLASVLMWIFIGIVNVSSSDIIGCVNTGRYDTNGNYIQFYEVILICRSSNNNDRDSCYYNVFSNHYASYSKVLRTGGCRGSHLDEQIRNKFNNLRILDFSWYGVESLSSVDLNFGNLQELNATHNRITYIPASLFVHAPSITKIDFSFNAISNIDENAFSTLYKLEFLDLQHNFIKTFHGNTFAKNNELISLYLNDNPNIVDCNIFLLEGDSPLRTVYVSWKNVTNFDTTCTKVSFDVDYDNSTFRIQTLDEKSFEIDNDSFENIKYFNISGNQLLNTAEVIHLLGPSVEIMDVSSNRLDELNARMFEKFVNLTYLDLRSTEISTILPDVHLFLENSRNLETLLLQNNPIKRFECDFLKILMNSTVFQVSWDSVEELDTSCFGNSLQIELNDGNEVIFLTSNSSTALHVPKTVFQNLRFLNISGMHLKNTPEIIQLLGSSVETLDLKNNFIGKMDAYLFDKFDNMQNLNLSRTNLTDFGFKTFYNQRKLKMLDISENHLKAFDFKLLFRNFKELTMLNLEGNDLKEVNTVTKENFPQLLTLGISKNHFSCEYLSNFLRQWDGLHLMNNPSPNQTHIDGVDCYHDDDDVMKNYANATTVPDSGPETTTQQFIRKMITKVIIQKPPNPSKSTDVSRQPQINEIDQSHTSLSGAGNTVVQTVNQFNETNDSKTNSIEKKENLNKVEDVEARNGKKFKLRPFNGKPLTNDNQKPINDDSNNVLSELRMLKYLFCVLIVMCCLYMVAKSNIIDKIRQKIGRNGTESSVAYQHNEMNNLHASAIELLEHDNGQKNFEHNCKQENCDVI